MKEKELQLRERLFQNITYDREETLKSTEQFYSDLYKERSKKWKNGDRKTKISKRQLRRYSWNRPRRMR